MKYRNFTLIEVVVALGILSLSLVGLLQLMISSQKRIAQSAELWRNQHMLMQAAEYYLLQTGEEPEPITSDFFDYPDYSAQVTYNDVDELPESFDGQLGQLALVGCKIEIVRDQDRKTVAETTVDRFNYESGSSSNAASSGGSGNSGNAGRGGGRE